MPYKERNTHHKMIKCYQEGKFVKSMQTQCFLKVKVKLSSNKCSVENEHNLINLEFIRKISIDIQYSYYTIQTSHKTLESPYNP